jgi:putative FmdB family regulatory protein
MPLFDAYCKECEAIWEVQIKLEELDEELICPDCGKPIIRMISAPAVRVH